MNRDQQKIFCERIRQNANGIIAKHINKRFSLPISCWLVNNTKITPNTVTFFNIFVGFSSGAIASIGTPLSLLWAGILFQVASILDGVDGEVAKMTNTTSQWGQWLDTFSDNGTLLSYLMGLTIGLHRLYPGEPVFMLAITTFIMLITILSCMFTFLRKRTNSGSLVTYEKEFIQKLSTNGFPFLGRLVSVLKYSIKKDFFSFLFFLLAIFGKSLWTLYLTSFGGTITALCIVTFSLSSRFKGVASPAFVEINGGEPARVTEQE